MGQLINEISRIKGIMGLINEGESQFDSSEKKTIDDFVDFVKKELKIDNDVEIKLQNDKDGIKTTAVYKYEDGDDKEIEKVAAHNKRAGINILLPNEKELKVAAERLKKQIIKYLKGKLNG